ncbi:MAG TPA: hypothetical protein VN843_25920, partial [Anaerolineales bacterium]|nr:hypothetical protein [Anaerolineales bacterium]
MRKVFAVIFKFIAMLLAALTILITAVVLLLLSFNHSLLNPQIVRQAFIKNKVYERVPAVTAEEFSLVRGFLVEPCSEALIGDSCLDQAVNTSQFNEASKGRLGTMGTAFINGLNEDQWKNLVIYLLPPNELQEITETTMDEHIAYFKGKTDIVKISLTNIKTRLINMTDEELTTILLSTQPTCTLDQQTLIMSSGFSESGIPPIFCSATGGTSQVLLLDLQRRLTIIVSEIPDHAILIKAPSPSNPP